MCLLTCALLVSAETGKKGVCLHPGWLKERMEVSSGLGVVMAAGELGWKQDLGN